MTAKGEWAGATRFWRTALRLAAVSCCILHPSPFAWADHPFATDDSGTQGAGNWKIELMSQHDRHDSAADAGAGLPAWQTRSTLLNPVLTYGLRDDLDLALGLNHLRNRAREDGVPVGEASGNSDSSIEMKWRFYERDGLSLAVKPGLSLPTGDENRGLGAGRLSWAVTLIGTLEGERCAWFGNIAYNRARYSLAQDAADNRAHLWRVSWGAMFEVREGFRLAGELGARANSARADPLLPGRHARFAMLGAIWSPSKRLDLDAGVRKALNRAEPDTVLLAGATLRW